MATGKNVSILLLALVSATSIYAQSRVPESTGRKLFGGYRIVPKACKPSFPSRMKSNEPMICMFNYECSRRNGEVVGACMDGFLFGACCQLPPKGSGDYEKTSVAEELLDLADLDHVPDIPILLNPEDGTPIGVTVPETGNTGVKTGTSDGTNHYNQGTIYTRISTLSPSSTYEKPSSTPSYSQDSIQNAEKPQIQMQPDISHLEEDFQILLGQHHILDELSLPGLLSHSDSSNDIQEHQDNSVVNPVTTLLSPDQVLQIADPVDQLPALFSQGLGQSNHTSADTILLNENGTALDETNNPDDLFKPSGEVSLYTMESKRPSEGAESTTEMTRTSDGGMSTEERKEVTQDSTSERTSTTQWVRFPDRTASTTGVVSSNEDKTKVDSVMTKLPSVTQVYEDGGSLTTTSPQTEYTMQDNFEKISTIQERVSTKDIDAVVSMNDETTTPMSTEADEKEELVRVPTITYNTPSGNKKNDVTDKEEIAINHIISILNDTTPTADKSATVPGPSSSIHTWVSIDETAKPSSSSSQKTSSTRAPGSTLTTGNTFPYTFYRPSTYYNYETIPTETSFPSLSTVDPYSQRPSTQTNYGGSSSSFGYSSRPTTNPPAPTVIVLGPLGTEFTTETTPKSVTRKPAGEISSKPPLITARPTAAGPIRPGSVSTKRPSVSTTITHNISTVISNVATNNNRVVSTSFITVNLKDETSAKPTVTTAVSTEAILADNSLEERSTTRKPPIWTTLSSWPDKPSFYLKPSTPSFNWPEENQTPANTVVFKRPSESLTGVKHTTSNPCDEETAAPDDLINFPPVRNPNLNISAPTSQQEKPMIIEAFNHTRYPDIEIISENDIPTPTFIEDDVLTNKVDTFVNKIVESLQGNFQDLKAVVYNRANVTTTTTSTPAATKRPTSTPSSTKKPIRRPASTSKPVSATTKRPTTTKRPGARPSSPRPIPTEKPRPRPTTSRPRPSTSHATTKKPSVTTRRPKPTRRPTTTQTPTTEAVLEEETTSVTLSTEISTVSTSQTSAPGDFRKQCGVRSYVRKGKIVGGKASEFGDWPWQVLVREATWLGLFTKNKCGGVLITDRYVLTAAHCQPGFLAALVAVFGEFDLSGELEDKRSVTRNVRNVIVNRAYNPTTFENDLALLELESPVQFDEHIVPICMPDDGIDFTGRMATVTGWGRLKYNGGVPSVLQEVQVPIMENSVCQEMFLMAGYSKLILDSFLCAGYATGQKDSCEGDSGGPLVMKRPDGRWFLVGTVSHGIKCASPYLPGVYMRTTHFKPWLNKVTGVL